MTPYEVRIFNKFVPAKGKILLVGYTPELQPLCTEMAEKNWFGIKGNYDAVIGNLILNYHGEPLLQHLRKLAPITVLRSATIGPYPYLLDCRGTPNAKLNINSSKGRIVSIWG